MSKFKVGDRVVSHSNAYGITKKGWVGTVTRVYDYDGRYYITAEGPGLGSNAKIEFPALKVEDFDLYTPDEAAQKIVVTTDGKTTTARLFDGKNCVKSAKANLSKKDTFSFESGAALAVDRLLGREEKKPAEPEPTKFLKEKMVTGVFGRCSDGDWFVVVGGTMVYEKGEYDCLGALNPAGVMCGYSVDVLVDAVSFDNARDKARAGDTLWKRPGAKFK